MTESYQDKLDNFSRGRSFVKLRGGVCNSIGELCGACGSGQPGTLFGIRDLLTGLDHFVGYNCLQELMRMKAVLQSRVRETTEEAFTRAHKSRGNHEPSEQDASKYPSQDHETPPVTVVGQATSWSTRPGEATPAVLPPGAPVIATPTLVVWETKDAFRAAVQIQSRDGLPGVWGAAEQPKRHQRLSLQPDSGFLLTNEHQYDRSALARCVRLATQNAHLTLRSQLARSRGNNTKPAKAEATSNG